MCFSEKYAIVFRKSILQNTCEKLPWEMQKKDYHNDSSNIKQNMHYFRDFKKNNEIRVV